MSSPGLLPSEPLTKPGCVTKWLRNDTTACPFCLIVHPSQRFFWGSVCLFLHSLKTKQFLTSKLQEQHKEFLDSLHPDSPSINILLFYCISISLSLLPSFSLTPLPPHTHVHRFFSELFKNKLQAECPLPLTTSGNCTPFSSVWVQPEIQPEFRSSLS